MVGPSGTYSAYHSHPFAFPSSRCCFPTLLESQKPAIHFTLELSWGGGVNQIFSKLPGSNGLLASEGFVADLNGLGLWGLSLLAYRASLLSSSSRNSFF